MKKNNGFTLIELLAVIVILAVIALIATPAVLNIIDDARVSSAERSTEAFQETVRSGRHLQRILRRNVLYAV